MSIINFVDYKNFLKEPSQWTVWVYNCRCGFGGNLRFKIRLMARN
jgi:hypothetical protein